MASDRDPGGRLGCDAPLCFIEPQDAIRVIAESVGREARLRLVDDLVALARRRGVAIATSNDEIEFLLSALSDSESRAMASSSLRAYVEDVVGSESRCTRGSPD